MSKLLDNFSQTQNSIREGEKTVSIAQKLFFVTFFSLSLEKERKEYFISPSSLSSSSKRSMNKIKTSWEMKEGKNHKSIKSKRHYDLLDQGKKY